MLWFSDHHIPIASHGNSWISTSCGKKRHRHEPSSTGESWCLRNTTNSKVTIFWCSQRVMVRCFETAQGTTSTKTFPQWANMNTTVWKIGQKNKIQGLLEPPNFRHDMYGGEWIITLCGRLNMMRLLEGWLLKWQLTVSLLGCWKSNGTNC